MRSPSRMNTQLVKERCNEMSLKPAKHFSKEDMPARMMISDRYKLLGCKAAKVASTNLQRIFYILEGFTNTHETETVNKGAARKKMGRHAKKRTIEELNNNLHSYTTFMFVRHPLERIVSAYRDGKPGMFKLFKKRKQPLNFTTYIDRILNKKGHFARPLRPINELCKPCEVNYDFVASLDNFDREIITILTEVGAENKVNIPQRNVTGYKERKSSSVVEEYYKDVPLEKIKALEAIYKTDFDLFGIAKYSED